MFQTTNLQIISIYSIYTIYSIIYFWHFLADYQFNI